MALSEIIRGAREAAGLSRAALSIRSGVSPATIARIELEGHTPKLASLAALGAALEIPVSDLVDQPAA